MSGPLHGVKVVEIASIGPGPFCCMVLADLGAEVTRVERPNAVAPDSDPPPDVLQRGRTASLGVNLKDPDGVEVLLRLIAESDVLVEGFRPGVMERLGLGPDACLERNPRLIYGRITGWGQNGSRAPTAGHDIDYMAIAGALHQIGDPDRPPAVPLNLVADFGGGGMLVALGIVAALFARGTDGPGEVVDAAMVDGVALLTAMEHGMVAAGLWSEERGSNLLDGGAPFYRTYETADGGFVAVGALEPQFFAALLEGLGLVPDDMPPQYDRARWPEMRERFAALFRTQTRAEWAETFAGTDACVAPVNTLSEAVTDPHMESRGAFVEVSGLPQPAPAPRFEQRPGGDPDPARPPGADTDAVLAGLGFDEAARRDLRRRGVIA